MTVEISPENVETIARRVVELLLHARDRQQQQQLGNGGDRERRGAHSPMMSPPSSPPSSSAHQRPGYPRRARMSVPLLPIRGYDGDGRWIDIEFDPTGTPVQRDRQRPPAYPPAEFRPAEAHDKKPGGTRDRRES
jgi:hypothetical protein